MLEATKATYEKDLIKGNCKVFVVIRNSPIMKWYFISDFSSSITTA